MYIYKVVSNKKCMYAARQESSFRISYVMQVAICVLWHLKVILGVASVAECHFSAKCGKQDVLY